MGRPRGRRKVGIGAGGMVVDNVTGSDSCGGLAVGWAFSLECCLFVAEDGNFLYHVTSRHGSRRPSPVVLTFFRALKFALDLTGATGSASLFLFEKTKA